jgi:sterol desaturase/sphingolipid hydroxylase (fatty acid hydroxylase superfamily)
MDILTTVWEGILDFLSKPTTWLMAGGALVIITLERIFPYNRGQKFFREGWFTDFFWYNIFQNLILAYIIFTFIAWVDNSTGLSRMQIITGWPFWLQVAFFVITHDLYIYLFHRWQHRNLYLWRIHEAHHSVKHVDWIAGARSHSLEILVNQTIEFLPIFLLGAHPEVILWKGVVNSYWGMFIHSNINARTDFWLFKYIINGPQMHRWHHSEVVEHGSYNYATKFAFWDWIWGTAYCPQDKICEKYGIAEVEFPKNYFIQNAFAFRPFDDVDLANVESMKGKKDRPEKTPA